MRRFLRPLIFVVVGFLIAFPVFFFSMDLMVETSQPGFCGQCHEIRPAVVAWRASTHVNNAKGLKADCMDCHLPPPEDTLNFFAMKTYHGAKDVFFHVLEGSEGYDKEEARQGMYAEVNNQTCLNCHENILDMPRKRGAMLAHRSVLYPRVGMEKKCIDCHYDLVHEPKTSINYAHYREYRSKGLRLELIRPDRRES